MKIELARKSSSDSSWKVHKYDVDEKIYRWLVNELVNIQLTDASIYYRRHNSINLSNDENQIYHLYLTDSGYRRAKSVLARFAKNMISKSRK